MRYNLEKLEKGDGSVSNLILNLFCIGALLLGVFLLVGCATSQEQFNQRVLSIESGNIEAAGYLSAEIVYAKNYRTDDVRKEIIRLGEELQKKLALSPSQELSAYLTTTVKETLKGMQRFIKDKEGGN